jgi:Txe/YoeB family toxin of toxin-antitoxin system
VSREVVYSKQALKDAKKLKAAGLKARTEELLEILRNDPFQNPPTFEKLVGDLAGAYSRRINIHNCLADEVFAKETSRSSAPDVGSLRMTETPEHAPLAHAASSASPPRQDRTNPRIGVLPLAPMRSAQTGLSTRRDVRQRANRSKCCGCGRGNRDG